MNKPDGSKEECLMGHNKTVTTRNTKKLRQTTHPEMRNGDYETKQDVSKQAGTNMYIFDLALVQTDCQHSLM